MIENPLSQIAIDTSSERNFWTLSKTAEFSPFGNVRTDLFQNEKKQKRYEKYFDQLKIMPQNISSASSLNLLELENQKFKQHNNALKRSQQFMEFPDKKQISVPFGIQSSNEIKTTTQETIEEQIEREKQSDGNIKKKLEIPQKQQIENFELDWDHSLFQAQRLPYQKIKQSLKSKIKIRCEIAYGLAPKVWQRTLRAAEKIHEPDIFVHPSSKRITFPKTKELMEKTLKDGFIPLAAGDVIRYKLNLARLSLPGIDHVALYVGGGLVAHLMREKSIPGIPNLGFVILESITNMFAKGNLYFTSFEESKPKKSRIEIIRRALSSIGPYLYSISKFNCHNVLLRWKEEVEPAVGWGEALIYVWIILASFLLVLLFFLCLTYVT